MSFNPEQVRGQRFSVDEIMQDLNIDKPGLFRDTVLNRCRLLYSSAEQKGKLQSFDTPYPFIVCESSEFFQTLVNIGYGNPALVVADNFSPDAYFLLFSDKVPEELRSIVAIHEVTEYELVRDGQEQSRAHLYASKKEIELASKLNLKEAYIEYLRKTYPMKLQELEDNQLIKS